jgi:hypothetical protein
VFALGDVTAALGAEWAQSAKCLPLALKLLWRQELFALTPSVVLSNRFAPLFFGQARVVVPIGPFGPSGRLTFYHYHFDLLLNRG